MDSDADSLVIVTRESSWWAAKIRMHTKAMMTYTVTSQLQT